MTHQTIKFKAEVAKVLDIVIHALYSHAEIFLRELISNSSDACDKLRYALLVRPELAREHQPFKITLTPNAAENTLTVSDNGIGMNRDDLINHLGTIARSGSAEFLKSLTGDKQKDRTLIGQFGVGFYSSFMVAERVMVISRKAGDSQGHVWESSGAGSFTVREEASAPQGTSVKLFLKKDAATYLEPIRLRHLVKQYSDHISVPIALAADGKEEILNTAGALWTRPKAEITESQYKDFYQSVAQVFDAPWATLHYKAEGVIDYTALLFIPEKPPFDLFQPDRKGGLQLYVNRVFITSELPELMPHYLRFMTGVIDTRDLPLNVSREMLQQTPVMAQIKKGLVHRILAELKKRAEDAESYAAFWKSFGIVFKEGLYEPLDERAEIAELCRFASTAGDSPTGLADYVKRMPAGQECIYYLTGENADRLRNHPQLEGFAARGIEVLLLSDPIDEFWTQTFTEYGGKKIVSVMHVGEALDKIKPSVQNDLPPLGKEAAQALAARAKEVLQGQVGDVRLTERLTKSPCALVTPEGHMSLHLERLMRAHGQAVSFKSARIWELNARHPLIHGLAAALADKTDKADKANKEKQEDIGERIWLLYQQALIAEGESVSDAGRFLTAWTRILGKNL